MPGFVTLRRSSAREPLRGFAFLPSLLASSAASEPRVALAGAFGGFLSMRLSRVQRRPPLATTVYPCGAVIFSRAVKRSMP